MSDTVEGETTYKNWFQREGNAFQSMCMGIICVPLIIVVIFANELNLVTSQATADLIASAIVTPDCDPLSSSMGSLVFAACQVNAPDIADKLPAPVAPFVTSFFGASLSWQVEIFQWKESSSKDCQKDNTGGETCHTTYSYEQDWSTSPVDSGSFYDQSGRHQNYGRLPDNLPSGSFTVQPHTIVLSSHREPIGEARGFVLDGALQDQLPSQTVRPSSPPMRWEPWDPSVNSELDAQMLRPHGNYLGTYQGSPDIGDLRISIEGRTAQTASICAMQTPYEGNEASVQPLPPQVYDFWGRETYPLEYLRAGLMTREELRTEIRSENSTLAKLVRIFSLVAMMLAFNCIFQPLSVAADLLRILNYCTCCLGTILDNAAQGVICCVSCSSACWCFTLAFSVAWIYANPTYGLIGMIVLVALTVAGCVAGQQMKAAEGRSLSVQTPFVKLATGEGHSARSGVQVLPT